MGLLQSSAAALALLGDKSVSAHGRGIGTGNAVPAPIAALKPLPNPAPPITVDERVATAKIGVEERVRFLHQG